MKAINKKMIPFLMFTLICVFSSCSNMDDYKEFIENGEISYTGKIDSLEIYPGENRVLLEGLIIGDPKVSEYRVYWNNKMDSVVIPFNKSMGTDTLRTIIENLEDKIYSFEVRTFDEKGNSSIPVFATEQVYGERYQKSLINRPIISNNSLGSTLIINYASMDLTSGVIGTDVVYTNINNEEDKRFISIDSATAHINNFQIGSEYRYRTVFLPEEMAIDTFYTKYESMTPIGFIDKQDWEVIDYSSEEGSGEGSNGFASLIIDGKNETYWHSCWTCAEDPVFPHYITIDMKSEIKINGLEFIQRDGGRKFKDFEILVSHDKTEWRSLGNYILLNNADPQMMEFDEPEVFRYFKIVMKSSHDGEDFAALAEVSAFTS